MIDLIGGRSSRSYKLHPGLAQCKGDDLIDFVQSHKKHWDKPRDQAWAFWDKRLATAEPRTKSIISFPDPAEKVSVTAAQVTQLVEPLLQRIQALESDGLEEKVDKIDNRAKGINEWLGKIAKRVNGLKHELATYRQGLEDNLEDKARAINPVEGSGKFDLNINVRFLLR
jgi:DNA gyrase/topoisomerase IV subunit A